MKGKWWCNEVLAERVGLMNERVNDSMGTEKSECDKPKMMG